MITMQKQEQINLPMALQFLVSLVSFPLFFPFLLFLFMVAKTISKNLKTAPKLPPGPRKLPIIGSLHHLVGSPPPRCFRDLAKKHGPLMHLQLGKLPVLVASSANAAKVILKTQDLNFAHRPQTSFFVKLLTYGCKDVVFAPFGVYWREARKLCVLELLSMKRVESFRFVREEEVSKVIKSISASCNTTINLSTKFFALANNIVARAAFGNKIRDQERFLELLQEGHQLAVGFNWADMFPFLRLIPVITGAQFRAKVIHHKLDEILNRVIEEHRHKIADMSGRGEELLREDLLDVLLKIQKEGKLEVAITVDNIKAIILDMFTAGTNTTAITLHWAMMELMRNPSVMRKAQEEVRQVVGFDKKDVAEEDIKRLKYLKMVVKETLRLHPPGALLVPRESREDTVIDGYEIPKKTRVAVNVWAIGRDPNEWGDDAESFKPERFVNSSVEYKGAHFQFLPFGSGRRSCPGLSFGVATMELSLAQLLYHFDWKLPNGMKAEDIDMSEFFSFRLSPKHKLLLIPIPYNGVI